MKFNEPLVWSDDFSSIRPKNCGNQYFLLKVSYFDVRKEDEVIVGVSPEYDPARQSYSFYKICSGKVHTVPRHEDTMKVVAFARFPLGPASNNGELVEFTVPSPPEPPPTRYISDHMEYRG